ncbi:MAG: septum formation initiator family protein [Candidatus Gracilibacteria bacterium]|jgi:cell division protein FtsB|nr:septum formation initiator family protein [Candidatus Gracilibacteria bacterium]
MNKKSYEKSSIGVNLTIIFCFIVFVWILFAWGQSLVRTYQKDKAIAMFNQENERLKKENARLVPEELFLQSEQYKDKWAKERKNKINEGESVIILPDIDTDTAEAKMEGLTEEERRIAILRSRPNREQWWELFFSHKK